jgi:hypothetical protein
MRFPILLAVTLLFAGAHWAQAVGPGDAAAKDPLGPEAAAQDDFDRLDGTGNSGKTVQVIDWEGNLEIHVYPKGSLKGLAMKIDRKNKDKPVMVIGYRFIDNPGAQLIRRALLTMPLSETFKVYKDPTENEFDKIIVSNNGLAGDLVPYKLEAEPKQLYPDGHPALADGQTSGEKKRGPASKQQTKQPADDQPAPGVDEDGRITPFFMNK